jgi:hypothetical protein
MVVHKDGDAIMTSMQSYFPGRSGAMTQQFPWVATTGQATVFTVAGGTYEEFARRRRQFHFPNVKQVGNTALLMYRPNRDLTMLFNRTNLDVALYFPEEKFDEIFYSGKWRFGREGDSFVGVLSPCDEPQIGCDGTQEQAWVAMVGHSNTYGSFANFTAEATKGRLEIVSEGCFAAKFVTDSEPLALEWCQESSPAFFAVVGIATYFVLAILASVALCVYHKKKSPPMLTAAAPTCARLSLLLIILLFILYPLLTFAFVVGIHGEGTPGAIAGCVLGILILIALHGAAIVFLNKRAAVSAESSENKDEDLKMTMQPV